MRTDSSGGKAADEMLGYRRAFAPRYRAILLVHGFNVSQTQALKSYDKFIETVASIWPTSLHDLGVVFWPGDWRTLVLRNLAYPWRVPTARDCAADLADYLSQLSDPQNRPTELVIVAHSLGCRLVLESLRILGKAKTSRRITLVLMAAAVPLPWVHREIKWLQREGLRIVVLHSADDGVLRSLFPIGQKVAEPHFGPAQEAVGRFGNPATGVWWRAQRMPGYGHGDYWASRSIPRILCSLLGGLASRELASWHLENPARDEFAGTAARELPERRFGGD